MSQNGQKPLIGVTTFRKDSGKGYQFLAVTEAYVQALVRAGAIPLMVPLGLAETDLDVLRSRLDGMLFTGGGDVDPARYGKPDNPAVYEVDPDRDRVEIHLVHEVIETNLPFLGICRGLQVINVALGGTLYTDIGDQFPGAIRHDYWPGFPRDTIAHPVRVEEGTALAKILVTPLHGVNSLHHQGIDDLAPGLRVSAIAPDGLIEAFELPEHPFGLAVQWHPEWLHGEDSMPALFEALVKAAADGRG